MKEVTLREGHASDWPAILEFNRTQNERDGTKVAIPLLFEPDGSLSPYIAVVLVGECEGRVVQALWCERTVEMCFAGCDPSATAYARKDIDVLDWTLAQLGFRNLHCFVPKVVVDSIAKPLFKSGFKRDDGAFAHFYKVLRNWKEKI